MNLPPDLPRLVRIISDSKPLLEFITALAKSPEPVRVRALSDLATRMKDGNESPQTIELIELLRDNQTFDTVASLIHP